MEFVRKNAPGILICLVIAVPAWLLGQRFEVVGGRCSPSSSAW